MQKGLASFFREFVILFSILFLQLSAAQNETNFKIHQYNFSTESSPDPRGVTEPVWMGDGEKPNIIIVFTDEQSLRTIGLYRKLLDASQSMLWGKKAIFATKNINRLVLEGATFTNFYTVSPRCTPARGAFMTGTYPAANGATTNDMAMNGDAVTFAQILKEKLGYYTSYLGKVSGSEPEE